MRKDATLNEVVGYLVHGIAIGRWWGFSQVKRMLSRAIGQGAMGHVEIPAGPGTVTSEWLTQALHSTGTITESAVKSFEMEIIGQGKGFTGRVARFHLNYDGHEISAPATIVAKFPKPNPKLTTLFNYVNVYEREVRFYNEIAGKMNGLAPRCYYTFLDTERLLSILLLEDLTDACNGQDTAGCSLSDAERAIRCLAKFHAFWWQSPQLKRIGWMPSFSHGVDFMERLYKRSWRSYVEKFQKTLPESFLRLGSWLSANVAPLRRWLGSPPLTIAHGDYRLDNLFFVSGMNDNIKVIDWQTAMTGRGVSDVAYFAVCSLPIEQREREEEFLLKSYHSTLVENGVSGYSMDQCLRDYSLSLAHVLIQLIIAQLFLDISNEQHVHKIALRCAAAIESHDVARLLQ